MAWAEEGDGRDHPEWVPIQRSEPIDFPRSDPSIPGSTISSSRLPADRYGVFEDVHVPMLRFRSKRVINQLELVHLAVTNAPELSVLRIEREILREEVVRQQSVVDWNSFVSSNWDDVRNPVGSALDGANDIAISRGLNSQAGLSRQNWRGGNLSVSQGLGLTDSNSQFFLPENQSSTRLEIVYQQPLLRGANRDVNRSRLSIAMNNSLSSQERLVINLQDHVLGVIQTYWNLIRLRGVLATQRQLHNMGIETERIVSKRSRIDVNPILLNRCRATVARRQAAMEAAEYDVVQIQDDLLRRVYGDQFLAFADTELIPSMEFVPSPEINDVEKELSRSYVNRSEVRLSLQQIKLAAISSSVTRDQLLPVLNAVGSIGYQGLAGNSNVSDSLSQQFSLAEPTIGVGVEYRLPIGNRAAKAAHRQAQLRVQSLRKQLQLVLSNVGLDVRNAIHQTYRFQQQTSLLFQSLQLASNELQVLRERSGMLLDGDRLGPFYVDTLLSTQERLASAQRDYWSAVVDSSISVFQLQRANGTLVRDSQSIMR